MAAVPAAGGASVPAETAAATAEAEAAAAAAAAAEAANPRGHARRYTKLAHIGDGQFGMVYKAQDNVTGEILAIKRIKLGTVVEAREGLHRTALREIKFLREIQHENIVQLVDVFRRKSNISLVFEMCETDLEKLIKAADVPLSEADVKSFMLMTLHGMEYLHDRWILHRDLKPNNLLVTSGGVLKVADFGLATFYGTPDRKYTSQVVTIWYRAPELFFRATCYGVGVDMWALGCIHAELELRTPLLPGESDIDQLTKIFTLRGSPTEASWPGVTGMPDYIPFQDMPAVPLTSVFTAASPEAIDLIDNMLACNPNKRLTARQALQHPYFSTAPAPTPPAALTLPVPAAPKDNGKKLAAAAPRGVKREATGFDSDDDDDAGTVRRIAPIRMRLDPGP